MWRYKRIFTVHYSWKTVGYFYPSKEKVLILWAFWGAVRTKYFRVLPWSVVKFPAVQLFESWQIYQEGYRSGHNGAVLKTVRGQPHKGSNPLPSAKLCQIRTRANWQWVRVCPFYKMVMSYNYRSWKNGLYPHRYRLFLRLRTVIFGLCLLGLLYPICF